MKLVDPDASPYDISGCYFTLSGEPFLMIIDDSGECPLTQIPGIPEIWTFEETNKYRDERGFPDDDLAYRAEDLQISLLIADALENATLPQSLQWEKESLISLARGFNEVNENN